MTGSKNLLRYVFIALGAWLALVTPGQGAEPPSERSSKGVPGTFKPYGFDYGRDVEPVPAEIAVEISSPKYEIRKSERRILDLRQSGSVIEMSGFGQTSSPGDPVLPVRTYEIAVPPNIDWKTLALHVEPLNVATVSEAIDVIPAPPLMARVDARDHVNWGPNKNIVAGRNMNVYGKDQFFPNDVVRIAAQGQLRKWRMLKVEFSPVQYNPVKKQLRVVKSARVRLSFSRIGKEAFRHDPQLSDKFLDEEAKRRFLNFETAREWYQYVPLSKSTAAPVPDPDYVIITTNAIKANSARLADFVSHKTTLGYQVRVVTESDYGAVTGQAPNGTAEKIRQWLIDNYVPLGIHYVLLVGNPDPATGDVPMKMCWPNQAYYTWHESPTDSFYADLTGNWDLEGDGRFGEYRDAVDPAAPGPGVAADNFSVRWTGRLNADAAGGYFFAATSQAGVRVRVDGTLVIDHWTAHELATDSGSMTLTAGPHDIVVETYSTTGDGIVSLWWQPPGVSYLSTVPSDHLYHSSGGGWVAGGLDGQYFNDTALTTAVLARVDPSINFFWGGDDRGIGGVDFEPEVYVGRIPVYNADYAALDAIFQKIIDYESDPSPNWRTSFMNADVNLWDNQSDYKLGEEVKSTVADPAGFTTYRVYESNVSIAPPPECNAINPPSVAAGAPCNMLGEWANGGGYGLVTWSTHGGPEGAAGLIASANATSLDDARPSFVFQGSCLNGYPENANNLGYALLRHGAIGTVSASRVSWTYVFSPPPQKDGTNGNLSYWFSNRILSNQPIGHALHLTKAEVPQDWSWMNKMDYNLFGDPSVSLFRNKGGVVLLFDTSGSMSWSPGGAMNVPPAQQRLSLAKEAAYPFMTLLSEHGKARTDFGISVFPPHPWTWAAGCNGQAVGSMSLVTSTNTSGAVSATIPSLVAEGNTPLLAGLSTAGGLFGEEAPRAIVLLSDGYHNCPSLVDANGTEVSALIGTMNASGTRVYTIGFGQPTDVDHALLTRLANATGGQFYDVTTPSFDPATWSPATALQSTYKSILVDALGLETAADPTGLLLAGHALSRDVRVSEYDGAVSIFLSWETPQPQRLSLSVWSSDGTPVPLAGVTPGVSVTNGNTYTVVTVNRAFLRRPGKVGLAPWRLEIRLPETVEAKGEHYQYSVIVDSSLRMEPSIDSATFAAGDPILLTARILEQGRRVLGLKEVTVRMTPPEEGVGNWFAKHEVSEEALASVPRMAGSEPLTPLARKAYFLVTKRGIAFPKMAKPIQIRLYDDGTHGDAVANDGVYSARVSGTQKEGTYTFQFLASGALERGAFQRDKIIQKRVDVLPSRKRTRFVVTALPGQTKLRSFQVRMTPRDALGNYLGPGHANEIRIAATSGRVIGAIRDHLDGSYSATIALPTKTDPTRAWVAGEMRNVKFSFNLGGGAR